jgi:Ca2+-binding RTX toxin-like protein
MSHRESGSMRRRTRMRRAILVLTAMTVALAVGSGVALADTFTGTRGPDVLRGTPADDEVFGGAGADVLSGESGNDFVGGGNQVRPLGGPKVLSGDAGDDFVAGGLRSPTVASGGPGDDLVDGSPGINVVSGGSGNDSLTDGEVRGGVTDVVSGGPGDDVLFPYNEPAGRDLVDCGAGYDVVYADTADVLDADCEEVRYRKPTPSEFE